MEFTKIASRMDKSVFIKVANGHFATNHSHINQYVDLTDIKVRHTMAKRAAAILAQNYTGVQVDSIICIEGTRVLGAFMAEVIAQPAPRSMNAGADINVLTPEFNSNNQMIFLENMQGMVKGRSVLLLLGSASTGQTIDRALDCIGYYGGRLAGICTIFSAVREDRGVPVASVFTDSDLTGYLTYSPDKCEMCANNQRLDAIVNSFGFSAL